jgi:hypothetical protein
MTLLGREGDVRTVSMPNISKEALQNLAKPLVNKNALVIPDAHLSYCRCVPSSCE